MERGLDPWETSAGTLTILDKPTSAVKYARGVGLKDPIKDLVSLLVIVALEVAEKLAAPSCTGGLISTVARAPTPRVRTRPQSLVASPNTLALAGQRSDDR